MKDQRDGIDTERLISYLVGEIWPRCVEKFRAETFGVYGVVKKLARVFVLPKEASQDQLKWFTEFFTELPDFVSWVLNELRIESDKLMRLELNKRKGEVGALRFLALIGIKDWSKCPEFTESGAIQEAASQILKEDYSALDRKFENIFRKLAEREDVHQKVYTELVKKSVPPYRSVAATYPVIGERFPELVEPLDSAAHELRICKGVDGISGLQSSIEIFAEGLFRASESDSDSEIVEDS
ncbi:MAG: hypothetical protein KDN20_15385 [Verrucomicrobiae bacterium]|nr:hypothetical protein [Verrucomicrobiae bacterium]